MVSLDFSPGENAVWNCIAKYGMQKGFSIKLKYFNVRLLKAHFEHLQQLQIV